MLLYSEINRYLLRRSTPTSTACLTTQALWKKMKFLRVKGVGLLHWRIKSEYDPVSERLVVEDQVQRRRIIASANDSHLTLSLALKMKPFKEYEASRREKR